MVARVDPVPFAHKMLPAGRHRFVNLVVLTQQVDPRRQEMSRKGKAVGLQLDPDSRWPSKYHRLVNPRRWCLTRYRWLANPPSRAEPRDIGFQQLRAPSLLPGRRPILPAIDCPIISFSTILRFRHWLYEPLHSALRAHKAGSMLG